MDITLRQLEVFVAVADECHFGRAAAALSVSQPVVSQEIQRLERTIGSPLFDRSTRTVTLTDIGSALLAEARDVHAAFEAFADRAMRMSGQRVCRVRIAATPSVLHELLPGVMRRVEARMPTAILDEVAVETGEVGDALLHRSCDVGLGRFVEAPPGFTSELLRSDRVVVALSSRHRLAAEDSVDLAELDDLPLLLWRREQNPAYHDHLMSICTDRGLHPLQLISPARIVGGRSYLIADGRAFSLIPESTAGRIAGDIVVRPLTKPATLPLSMLWRTRDHRQVMSDLLDVIREVSAEMPTR